MSLLISSAAFIAAALAGLPLFVVLLGIALYGFWTQEIDLAVIGIEMFRLTDNTLLAAIPLFTFVGYVLSLGESAKRLVALAQAWFGWMPGGLGIMALLVCAFFTAFTGASGITIVAIGALLLPALQQAGYPQRFSLGLITSSGSLGLLFAPALPLILYGIIAQQLEQGRGVTLQDLFLAGALPGLLMVAALAGYTLYATRHAHITRTPFHLPTALETLKAAGWELFLPVLVLGGVFSGTFAVSEVAAIAALYVLLVSMFVYKELTLSTLPKLIMQSMSMVGAIMLVLLAAMVLTNLIIDAQLPQTLFGFMQTHVESRWVFLILLNIFLLLVGAFLDIFSALVLLVPLVLPLAVAYGIDPTHLGIIMLANLQIGYITPPVGMNLFIASLRFKQGILALYRACWPFMLVLLVVLVLITFVPQLSLWLPSLLR